MTGKQRAGGELADERNLYRDLVEGLPSVTWMLVGGTQFSFTSSNVEPLLGYSPDDVMGGGATFWLDRIHPDDAPRICAALDATLHQGAPFSEEYRLRRADGEYLWVLGQASQRCGRGETSVLIGSLSDISERKRFEQELRASEQKYSRLFFSNPDAVALTVAETAEIVEVNERCEEMFGISRAEALGKTTVELGLWQRPDERAQLLNEFLANGSFSNVEAELMTKSGVVLSCLLSGGAVEVDGRPHFLTVAKDITRRKEVQRALKLSEEKFAAAFRCSANATVLVDINTRTLLSVNDAFTRLTGYGAEEVVDIAGKAGILLSEEGAGQELWARAERRESIEDVKVTVATREVGQRTALIYGEPLRMTDRNVFVVTAVDITERERTEQALRHNEGRYRSLVELSTEAVFCYECEEPIDTSLPVHEQVAELYNCVLAECNDACARLYGAPRAEEVVGKRLTELFGTAEGSLDGLFTGMIQGGYRIVDGEGVEVLEDGSRRYFLNNGHGVIENGKLIRIWGTFRDITERRRREADLQRAYREIKELKERLETENVLLREEVKESRLHGELVGQSKGMRSVLDLAERVAGTDSSVLILGETGTGKELVARAIHNMSLRKDRGLVVVNCAALPATLIEGELFGREKGAFTGAITKQLGRFEMADRSTIFLDEIGELTPDLQVKLLRVLQEREVQRLGGTSTIRVDVRVIAATNRDLQDDVAEGRFRQDLFYRLDVFPIVIPALRDRCDDIPSLVWSFVAEFNQKMGKRVERIPEKTMEAVVRNPWPGNVRELRNAIERAMILCNGRTLQVPLCRPALPAAAEEALTLEDMERRHILRVLEATGWRVRGSHGAAGRLGLKPTTLESRMSKLGICRPTKVSGIS